MSKPSIKSAAVRPGAVAGRFYPDQPAELRRWVEHFLSCVRAGDGVSPKAVIAPHAGYSCSGPIAASAHARFASARDLIRRIVLLGPSHFVGFAGVAASSAEAFATPLGLVAVDTEAVRAICRLPGVAVRDEAHAREHSLEVHLPFLQVVLSEFKIVPLVVGDASERDVAEVVGALWGGAETRFVVSSDLSHYLSYARARQLDSLTGGAIEKLRPEDIGEDQACGRAPVCGWLRAAREHGLRGRTVDLRNSGDTGGPRDEVVGYGAFVFEKTARPA